MGLGFYAPEENMVIVSNEAVNMLPGQLLRGNRIRTIPRRLKDAPLPIRTSRCIPFTAETDVLYMRKWHVLWPCFTGQRTATEAACELCPVLAGLPGSSSPRRRTWRDINITRRTCHKGPVAQQTLQPRDRLESLSHQALPRKRSFKVLTIPCPEAADFE